jgi:hypothetical protein
MLVAEAAHANYASYAFCNSVANSLSRLSGQTVKKVWPLRKKFGPL